jgi:DNA mismatch endonuclease (patch repair protein)
MSDILSEEQRHRCMSRIKNKNTKPEILVRKFLFSKGFRFRLNKKDMPGKPDIVLPKYKTAIFINGCYWHGHENCKFSKLPETNREFWMNKINGNIKHDNIVREQLSTLGWNVITIWQCELKPKTKDNTLASLIKKLQDNER